MRLAVIIPTLDEELRIGERLCELRDTPGVDEVIVVDGGSSDLTAQAAESFPGVRVLQAQQGRAFQMNAGAGATDADILLFLHADVALPKDARRWIDDALADSTNVGGAFRTWTVADRGPRWWAPVLYLADLRSRYSGLPYGDQAQFVRAEVFRQVGGFPEQPLMEDVELARRLRRVGRLRTVPARVTVSGRRFQARPVFYTILVNVFPLLYRAGVAPRTLSALYGRVR